MDYFTIGRLAKLADVNLETIRFYERKGVMEAPRRNSSGYRQYSGEDLKRLKFIRIAQKHGFTLNEIGELLNLRVDKEKTCDDVRAIAEQKIEDINAKIRELRSIKNALTGLAKSCHSAGPVSECPILEEFSHER